MMAYRSQVRSAARRFRHGVQRDESRLRLVCAVKAGLVVSDAAGSALTREGLDLATWLKRCFQTEPLTGEAIEKSVINPRIPEIRSRTGSDFQWREWELATRELAETAFLLAPFGS